MALSDYERRVLREIEHELGRVHEPTSWGHRWTARWESLWTSGWAAPLAQALAWSLLVSGCVCAAIYAPATVAVMCVGLVGFGLGVMAGRSVRHYRPATHPLRSPVNRRWWPRSHG
jgi:hypothetical protein